MGAKKIEVVSLSQKSSFEYVDSWVAISDPKSFMAITVEGDDRVFLVQIPGVLYDALYGGPPEQGRCDDIKSMIEGILAVVRQEKCDVVESDDPEARTIGFVTRGNPEKRFYVPLTAAKGLENPLLARLIPSPAGRRKMAACFSHGHGPSEWESCTHCSAVLSGSSDVG